MQGGKRNHFQNYMSYGKLGCSGKVLVVREEEVEEEEVEEKEGGKMG
jgi:hypothetical protein